MTRDSVRDATQHEVGQLKRENGELKELVADLSLEAYRLKKTAIPVPQDAKTNKDLRTDQKAISHHGTVLLFRKNAQSCLRWTQLVGQVWCKTKWEFRRLSKV